LVWSAKTLPKLVEAQRLLLLELIVGVKVSGFLFALLLGGHVIAARQTLRFESHESSKLIETQPSLIAVELLEDFLKAKFLSVIVLFNHDLFEFLCAHLK
jgi:hypothetical protein